MIRLAGLLLVGCTGLTKVLFQGSPAPGIDSSDFNGITPNPIAYVPDAMGGGYELVAFTGRFSKVYTETSSFTTQPSPQTEAAGGSAAFTVAANTSSNAPNLQWQVSTDNGATWSDLAGETGAILTINGVTAGHDGNQYRCVALNFNGATLHSNTATLTVRPNDMTGIRPGGTPATGDSNTALLLLVAASFALGILGVAVWLRRRQQNP